MGDALGDREAEADARVVGPDAFVTAKKWLGERGDHLGRKRLAGVLDHELYDIGASTGRDPHEPWSGRLWTIALCTRSVLNCSRSAREPIPSVVSPEVSILTPRFSLERLPMY